MNCGPLAPVFKNNPLSCINFGCWIVFVFVNLSSRENVQFSLRQNKGFFLSETKTFKY